MTQGTEFRDDDRLLVVVPHPDDETLATGGLIQRALAAGIPLRVLVATDGDNNPWPQRWIEKRWRIDGEARRRWGARRREEARQALAVLGVPADAIRFFGWPDQGLTTMLMRDALADDALAAEIDGFSPGVVALPSLADRHPDHSALRVMLEVALRKQARADCRRLEYVVHGNTGREPGVSLSLSNRQQQIKQRALLAHATQISLSRRRMQRLCERNERYESSTREPPWPEQTRSLRWTMPRPDRLRRHELLLVVGYADRIERLRVPLRRGAAQSAWTTDLAESHPLDVVVVATRNPLEISLVSREPLQFVYAKIERSGHRVLIYDTHGWRALTPSAPATTRTHPEKEPDRVAPSTAGASVRPKRSASA